MILVSAAGNLVRFGGKLSQCKSVFSFPIDSDIFITYNFIFAFFALIKCYFSDVFKADNDYLENEERYKMMKRGMLNDMQCILSFCLYHIVCCM